MTLIELLVAMASGIVVMLALFATLEFSSKQEARITERVQANRGGRYAMTEIVENLHSACVGFNATAIQAPSTKPTSPLGELGPTDLWFISADGSSTSGKSVITSVYEHDVHWASTGKSKTGETVGTLTDYKFESTKGSGPSGKSGKWEFPALETKNATSRVLATNVIPQTISGTNTLFQYYKFSLARRIRRGDRKNPHGRDRKQDRQGRHQLHGDLHGREHEQRLRNGPLQRLRHAPADARGTGVGSGE